MLVPRPISSLPPRVPKPRSLDHGSWVVARLDTAGDFDFGPSMLELVMWFPVGDNHELSWAELGQLLGAERAPTMVTMNREAVQSLLPEADLPAANDFVEITGSTYAPVAFEGSGYFGARAVRIDGGLLVAVRTGG
jgi:hypothetical protein